MKWANARDRVVGVLFSAAGVYKIQLWMARSPGASGMLNTMVVDRFAFISGIYSSRAPPSPS